MLLAACLAAACTAQRDSSGEQPARQIGFEGSHVLVHPDGDALIVGIASSRGRGARCGRDKNERRYFQVVRVRPSGRVADTFDFVPDDDCAAEVSSTLLQPDGKLLLSGWIFHPSDAGFEDNSSQGPFVARFLPSGELDRSFGGDGRIGTGEPSAKIALQPDGAIVSASGRRLGHQGKFDEDFMPRVADSTFAGGIATLPDGSFFVASLVRSRMRSFVLQRFDRQGQVMGQTLTSFAGDEAVADAEVLDVIAAAGRIYVLGRFSLEVGSSAHFFLYRYSSNLALDRSFARSGRLTVAGRDERVVSEAVALQPDGKIVAVAWGLDAGTRAFVRRYTRAGRLDTTFGKRGLITLEVGPETTSFPRGTAATAALRPDGAIVVAALAPPRSTVLFRFRPDGSRDPTFADGGKLRLRPAFRSGHE